MNVPTVAGDIEPAWFLDHFTELFEHTAYRLETLDAYDDPGERPTLQAWHRGVPVPRNDWWTGFIKSRRLAPGAPYEDNARDCDLAPVAALAV